MAKTYNSIPTVATGDVYTATAHNNIVTNVNNYRVPPMCEVYRTSNQTSYTPATAITWQAERYDTDGMWSSGTDITIQTAGLYLVTFVGGSGGTATITQSTAGIRVNGTLAADIFLAVINSNQTKFTVSGLFSLAVNDTLQGQCNFVGGSAYFVNGSASLDRDQTRLSAVWVGQVS